MVKQKLIGLREDLKSLLAEVNKTDQDVGLEQMADINLGSINSSRPVLIIQNQTVNITITNNILSIIEKVDDAINYFDHHHAPVNSILKEFFTFLIESGITPRGLSEMLREEYISYADQVAGGVTAETARLLNMNRTTLSEIKNKKLKKV